MSINPQNWKLSVIATLCMALMAGDAWGQGRGGGGEGRRGGGGGGGGQRGGGGGGGGQRGGGGGDQFRGRAPGSQQRGGSSGSMRRGGRSDRGNRGGQRQDGGNPGGQRLDGPNRGRERGDDANRRDNRDQRPRDSQPRVGDGSRNLDRQERRTNRPDFDGDLRDGRRGDRDGFRFGDRDGRRGDGNWNRDWDRDGRDRNGWANSGWNGRWGRRHDGWRRGFWNWNNAGYRPWWGGYGGFGRTGLGVSLLGLGLGYNSWGMGGYGYPYGYGYGNNWGYGGWLNSGYFYNPYSTAPLTIGSTVVDYSQPLVTVDVIRDSSAVSDDGEVDDPNTLAAMADFDAARISFRAGDYDAALNQVHRAIERLPNDPALHEFRALVLFAQGNYPDAAAALHAVLASGPGWDWATLRGMYPDVETYTQQLRALEDFARANQNSADAQFVLGYHYLTEGYQDAGIERFRKVAALQPKDLLATRIVESAVSDATATSADEIAAPPADAAAAGSGAVNIDQLRGDWQATQEDGSKFNLSLTADNTFTWQFAQGDQSNSLQGRYSVSNDLLVLEPDSGTPLVARVSEAGDDGFRFKMAGTPEEDTGLKFSK